MSSNKGKTVLITGSSTGIGKATAAYFQVYGWNVAATMRRPELETELTELENVKCIALDVIDETSINSAIAETIETFGGIDVVVNNAGYGILGAFEATSTEKIRRQFDTNVFGLMSVTRAILPYFRDKRSGMIINVASTGGRMTWPLASLYHGTKWAVEGFSESLGYELRQFGIKVKIIEPGAIRTDFHGRSQDFAEQEGLLAYDEYVNRVMPNLQENGAKAPGPEVVAEVIYKAAIDTSNRIRYQAGSGASLLMFLRRLLPTRFFNWVVRGMVEKKKDRLKHFRDAE
jgi:short-subunit dehydrogenase